MAPGPLREISGDRDQVRTRFHDRRPERLEDGGIDSPEVQIREMHQRPHVSPALPRERWSAGPAVSGRTVKASATG